MRHTPLILPLAALMLAACQTTPAPAPDRFVQADVNGDGNLSLTEINDFMVTSIFDSRDDNKDKSMSMAEWDVQMTAAGKKLFAARDSNQDGLVSLEEAKAYAKKMGTYNAAAKEADTNKDGSVSRAEAIAYYDSKEGPIR